MKGKMLLLVAFLIICFNLRTGFDSPDPLLGTIEKDMGLSLEIQGCLPCCPCLCWAWPRPFLRAWRAG